MIRTVARVLLVAVVSCAVALAACGTTATKTVTKVAPATSAATTPPTNTATTLATSTATAPSPPTNTASTTTTMPVPVYFEGVAGSGLQRPSSLELTGDGTLYVSGVQWTSWGDATATGSGDAE